MSQRLFGGIEAIEHATTRTKTLGSVAALALAVLAAACSSGSSGGFEADASGDGRPGTDAAHDGAVPADGATADSTVLQDGSMDSTTTTGDSGEPPDSSAEDSTGADSSMRVADSGPLSADSEAVDTGIVTVTDSEAPADTGSTSPTMDSGGMTGPVDSGSIDSGAGGGSDTGSTSSTDSGAAPTDSGATVDTGSHSDGATAPSDAGMDATARDSAEPMEAAAESGATTEAGAEGGGTGADGATESGAEAGIEAGTEAGGGEDAGGPLACGATMAVLGGSATTAFAATWNGSWGAAQTLTGSVASTPALVSNGVAYVGAVRESGSNFIDYTLSGTTWSALTGISIGASTATTNGPPALAAVGSTVHLVYWGTNDMFYDGSYAAGSWTLATDPVGGASNQAFGPSAATAAGLQSGYDVAQAGQDSHLYVIPFASGWGSSDSIASDAYNLTPPRIVTLDAATGAQMIVYSRNDNGNDEVLMYSVSSNGTWSTPAVVHDATVYTPNTVSIAPLSGGRAVLLYQGGNGLGYSTIYDPTQTPTWSAPTALVAPNNPPLASPPEVAPGVCGEDAVAVFAPANGSLSVTTFTGGAWSTPTALAGTSGATYATIATQACTSTMAVVGGSGTTAFASTWNGGTWATAQALSGSTTSVPAILSNGTAYLAVLRQATTNDIDYTVSGATWSALAGVPASGATATTNGAPALALVGTTVHLVYSGTNDLFYHGSYASSGTWTSASDPVGGSTNQAFGPSAPTAAGLGTSFDIVQTGQDSNVYVEPWSTTWGASTAIASDGYNLTPPRIVTLTGGSASQLVVYARNDNQDDEVLMYSVLTGSTWSTPAVLVGATAYTPNTVALAPLAAGGALMVYQGADGLGYFAIYDPSATSPWSTPAALLMPNAALASPPQIAPGVCGAQAAVVLVPTGGSAEVMTFTGASWSAPAAIAGTTAATFAAIASQP